MMPVSRPPQGQQQQQQQTSSSDHKDLLNIEDLLDVSMNDETNNETAMLDQNQQQQKQRTDKDYIAPQKDANLFMERLASSSIKVDSIFFQCGSQQCANKAMGSIAETVTLITSNWKGQAEALCLSPVHTLDFYRRQYEQLCQVLSICLFSQRSDSPIHADSKMKNERENATVHTDDAKQTVEKKRKRTATPSNDCELIFFEKNGKFVYRRVESAAKYAKRNKPIIDRYVYIMPKSEEYREHTRNCMTKLRSSDTNFASGSELNFTGTLLELQKELAARMIHNSLDEYSVVNYEDETSTAAIEVKSGKDTAKSDRKNINVLHKDSPPVKKIKYEGSEPRATSAVSVKRTAKKKTRRPAVGEETTYRSGVEEYTEESEDGLESENGEGDMKDLQSIRTGSLCKVTPGSMRKEGRHGEIGTDVTVLPKTNRNHKIANELELERPPSPFL